VPQAKDLEDLNQQLLASYYQDEERKIDGHDMTVGQAILAEKEHLLPLVEEGFDLAEVSFPKVDHLGRARIRGNFYSVPVRAGLEVEAKVYSSYVEVWHGGQCIARHERSYSSQQEILDLEHYLEPLEHKPGALAGSKPLEQWRQKGRWPASFDRIWEQLMIRSGRQEGTRRMIELLGFGKTHGYETLRGAVESALEMGSCDISTVWYLMTAGQLERGHPEPIDVGPLSRYERPMPVMTEYDQLLSPVEVMP